MSESEGGSRKYLYLTVCTENTLALCAGLSMAWTSPVLPKLLNEENIKLNPFGRIISEEEASWIGSCLPLGGIIGTLLAGISSAKVGRKPSFLICCGMPFLAAYSILGNATNISLYFMARIMAGVGVSSVYTLVPMYTGEIAEVSIRGRLCSSITMFEATGELLSYCIGPSLTIFWFCATCFFFTILAVLLIIFILPESPYYLIMIEDKNRAEESLMKLRLNTSEGVKEEMEFMQSVVDESRKNKGRIGNVLKAKALRRALTIMLGIVMFQNFSGIIPVLFNAQSIFEETGSSIPSDVCAMIVGAVQCSASFITPNLVDRLGRRKMLSISATGMLIAQFHLGLYFFLKENGTNVDSIYWLPVVCLVCYIVSYVLGFGPLPWTVMGEVFPANMKSAAAALTVCTCWSLAFVVSKSYHSVAVVAGTGSTFWIFACSCVLANIFIWTYLIETKGKNFQEIQDILNK